MGQQKEDEHFAHAIFAFPVIAVNLKVCINEWMTIISKRINVGIVLFRHVIQPFPVILLPVGVSNLQYQAPSEDIIGWSIHSSWTVKIDHRSPSHKGERLSFLTFGATSIELCLQNLVPAYFDSRSALLDPDCQTTLTITFRRSWI